MLNRICAKISNNKNLLMLASTAIYVLALFSTLSELLLLSSVLLLILFLFLLIKDSFPIKYIIAWTFLFVFGVVNVSIRLNTSNELLNIAPMNSSLTGTVISIPQNIAGNKLRFFIKADSIQFGDFVKKLNNEKVLVTIVPKASSENVKLYNSAEFRGRLSIPFKAGNPSQFDYGNYLRNHHANTVFYAKDFSIIKKELSLKSKFFQGINDYRERILSKHSKYLSSPNIEILGGIVFGDDAVTTPKEIKESFVSSGLLHILAASGMNVAFIYSFFKTIYLRYTHIFFYKFWMFFNKIYS